jgi:hypothetical protein
MNDDLIYRIFVELAVLEEKRDVNGKWLVKEPSELAKLLKRAHTIVERAASGDEGVQRPPGKATAKV